MHMAILHEEGKLLIKQRLVVLVLLARDGYNLYLTYHTEIHTESPYHIKSFLQMVDGLKNLFTMDEPVVGEGSTG